MGARERGSINDEGFDDYASIARWRKRASRTEEVGSLYFWGRCRNQEKLINKDSQSVCDASSPADIVGTIDELLSSRFKSFRCLIRPVAAACAFSA